jgi:hypothetical protein
MYAVILTILMILELTGFIMAMVYKSKLESVYRDSLTKVFLPAVQKNDTKVLNAFHELEKALKCCGVNGKEDYLKYWPDAPTDCYLNKEGCADTIINLLKNNLPIVGGTLGTVLFLELLGLIGAIVLAVAIKHAPDDTYSSNPAEVIKNIVPGRRRNYNRVS